jgi:hypothetical protein
VKDLENTIKDLYRDLRSKRLLPVVAILIVAIVAVPMALGSGSTPATPQTQLAVGIKPLAETQTVVLPTTPELRNFHKRLNEYDKKNPFHQPQAPVVKTSGSSGSDATTDASAATSTGTSTDTSVTTPTDTGATTPPTDTGTTTTPTDTGTSTTPTGPDTSSSGAEVVTYDIDVLVGAVGEEKEIDGVKSLQLLPGDSHPVLQYVTTDLGGHNASFVVSNAVTNADGTGRCAPSRFDCEFLQLDVGESERLEYGPTSRTYRIKLLGITQQIDPLQVAGDAAGDVSGRIGFSAGLPSTDTSFTPAG